MEGHITERRSKWSVGNVKYITPHIPPSTLHCNSFHFISREGRAPIFLCHNQKVSPRTILPFSIAVMRTLSPNYDREGGLETVLEVPIPEATFSSSRSNSRKPWQGMKSWVKQSSSGDTAIPVCGGARNTEIQLLLGVVGAPLIPLPLKSDHTSYSSITAIVKDHPIEASMAKYIVKQYIAAVGGEKALSSVESMYAMGKVRMAASEFCAGDENAGNKKVLKLRNLRNGGGEVGGFVVWQKRPELWCLELMVSGCKISAGSDGKVAWRQTPWHRSHASRGPPRPLRRFLQGLDPRSTASLFSNSVCIGEKSINDEDCFILKLEAEQSTLRARSGGNVEIIRHTIWGYFSQRTGLLVQLEDSHLLRMKTADNNSIFWETTMESLVQDYRSVDGICIAHSGKTSVSLSRFGENSEGLSRTRMEEAWMIEEVDFNVKGLSIDCFLPPADLKHEEESCGDVPYSARQAPPKVRAASFRVCATKVVAVDDEMDDSDNVVDGHEKM